MSDADDWLRCPVCWAPVFDPDGYRPEQPEGAAEVSPVRTATHAEAYHRAGRRATCPCGVPLLTVLHDDLVLAGFQ